MFDLASKAERLSFTSMGEASLENATRWSAGKESSCTPRWMRPKVRGRKGRKSAKPAQKLNPGMPGTFESFLNDFDINKSMLVFSFKTSHPAHFCSQKRIETRLRRFLRLKDLRTILPFHSSERCLLQVSPCFAASAAGLLAALWPAIAQHPRGNSAACNCSLRAGETGRQDHSVLCDSAAIA